MLRYYFIAYIALDQKKQGYFLQTKKDTAFLY